MLAGVYTESVSCQRVWWRRAGCLWSWDDVRRRNADAADSDSDDIACCHCWQ